MTDHVNGHAMPGPRQPVSNHGRSNAKAEQETPQVAAGSLKNSPAAVWRCQKCGSDGEVMETRKTEHTIRRARRCPKCGLRWSTWETTANEAQLLERTIEALRKAGVAAQEALRDYRP